MLEIAQLDLALDACHVESAGLPEKPDWSDTRVPIWIQRREMCRNIEGKNLPNLGPTHLSRYSWGRIAVHSAMREVVRCSAIMTVVRCGAA